MSRYSFTYPTKGPERSEEEVEISLRFREWSGGVIVVATNERTLRRNNLLYITSSGVVRLYPRQAKDVGLEAKHDDGCRDELRVLVEAAERYKKASPLGLCMGGAKWHAKKKLDEAIEEARRLLEATP